MNEKRSLITENRKGERKRGAEPRIDEREREEECRQKTRKKRPEAKREEREEKVSCCDFALLLVCLFTMSPIPKSSTLNEREAVSVNCKK